MRFATESCEALEAAVLDGMPILLVSAGQAGATAPAALAGAVRARDELGIDVEVAFAALAAPTETALVEVLHSARVEWQIEALLALATGTSVEDVRKDFRIDQPVPVAGEDDDDARLLRSLEHPAAQTSFHWIEDNDELRRRFLENVPFNRHLLHERAQRDVAAVCGSPTATRSPQTAATSGWARSWSM